MAMIFAIVLICALIGCGSGRPESTALGIIGGNNAYIQNFPWQLGLIKWDELFCGAVLIHANWALTTAHCVYGVDPTTILIRHDSHFIWIGKSSDVKQVIIHPNFRQNVRDYDVAVLRANEPMTGANCKPIALATGRPTTGEKLTVSGWGMIHENDQNSYKVRLQSVVIPVTDQNQCKQHFHSFAVNDHMFCAMNAGGGHDFCTGDQGGPAVAGGKLVGLMAYQEKCGHAGIPGLYMNIGSFVQWIHEKTGIRAE